MRVFSAEDFCGHTANFTVAHRYCKELPCVAQCFKLTDCDGGSGGRTGKDLTKAGYHCLYAEGAGDYGCGGDGVYSTKEDCVAAGDARDAVRLATWKNITATNANPELPDDKCTRLGTPGSGCGTGFHLDDTTPVFFGIKSGGGASGCDQCGSGCFRHCNEMACGCVMTEPEYAKFSAGESKGMCPMRCRTAVPPVPPQQVATYKSKTNIQCGSLAAPTPAPTKAPAVPCVGNADPSKNACPADKPYCVQASHAECMLYGWGMLCASDGDAARQATCAQCIDPSVADKDKPALCTAAIEPNTAKKGQEYGQKGAGLTCECTALAPTPAPTPVPVLAKDTTMRCGAGKWGSAGWKLANTQCTMPCQTADGSADSGACTGNNTSCWGSLAKLDCYLGVDATKAAAGAESAVLFGGEAPAPAPSAAIAPGAMAAVAVAVVGAVMVAADMYSKKTTREAAERIAKRTARATDGARADLELTQL